MGKYDDMLHLEHHRSKKRAPMPMLDRAAQFAPFAALSGHDELMEETARVTTVRLELDENRKEEINRILQIIYEETEMKKSNKVWEITYFQEDPRKEGGVYQTLVAEIKKIDSFKNMIVLKNGKCILIEDLWEIEERYENIENR